MRRGDVQQYVTAHFVISVGKGALLLLPVLLAMLPKTLCMFLCVTWTGLRPRLRGTEAGLWLLRIRRSRHVHVVPTG